jgi:hypothetical protein
MPNLSPAAQAVKDAVLALYSDEKVHEFGWQLDLPTVSAALRAATDQVVPEHREHYPNTLDERYRKISAFDLRNQLFAIAAELEGRQ